MNTTQILSYADLEHALNGAERSFLFIYRKDAEQSECALKNIIRAGTHNGTPLFTVDVSQVRDVHPRFGITSAPSLLLLQQGKVTSIIKGCQPASYYESILNGRMPGAPQPVPRKKAKQVIVYTAPSCSWCNTLKTYLKTHGVSFREVNVATDQASAEAMVKKSGQQGVPQTEIDGRIIVGFDREKIDQLLEIQ